MKKILLSMLVAAVVVVPASPVFADVVVTPEEVGVGLRQVFSMTVPNEREVPVTSVRLVIPEGVTRVTPNAKADWTVETKKTGAGEDALVSEIIWNATSGNGIPVELRDDFVFRAAVPAKETDLNWKAYETYADGTVVAWDKAPSESENEAEEVTAYSVTKVVNDLAGDSTGTTSGAAPKVSDSPLVPIAFVTSLVAAGLAGLAIVRTRK